MVEVAPMITYEESHMRVFMFMGLFLFSIGVGAQVRVGDGVISGLPSDEVVEYSGMTPQGHCFVVTRQAGPNWDTITYKKLYDGVCPGELKDHGAPMVRKFRDGRVAFDYNLHQVAGGPAFDTVLVSALTNVPSVYKRQPFAYMKLEKR